MGNDPISTERFKLIIAEVYVTFKTNDSGKVTGFTMDRNGDKTEATRIE